GVRPTAALRVGVRPTSRVVLEAEAVSCPVATVAPAAPAAPRPSPRRSPTSSPDPGEGWPAADARQAGVLSLEAVWILPALALLVVGLLLALGLVRDVLLLHEAARAGVRAAVVSSGADGVATAARQAAPELDLTVQVHPVVRHDGDLVTVRVHTTRTIGPVDHRLSARAVGRVEPAVGPGRPSGGPIHGPVAP
ncbi:MAG: hypothetical protein EA340_11580, partial [Nitriliruptor sp.]